MTPNINDFYGKDRKTGQWLYVCCVDRARQVFAVAPMGQVASQMLSYHGATPCPKCGVTFGHNLLCPEVYVDLAPATEPAPVPIKRCECGSEKTYGPQATHSDWCPKHA